ncbi:MAG: RNA polymerase subunit sigma-70, partial [Ilumatobacter sp.]|nr:RNA polymerase subunit sigma-70 [Ilumatobacter sp.]
RELGGYCYRVLGSASDAEDAVQETMVRAWKGADRFEQRSSMKTWIYRIATNVCLDMRKAPQRRALPMDLGGPAALDGGTPNLATRPAEAWIGPIRTDRLTDDPADAALLRDSVGLAFLAALQQLPPKQRAVVVLRDVLSWSAEECAATLETSVASVNSALARARSTLAKADATIERRPADPSETRVLEQYLAAFEAYDVDRLVALLADDVVFSMPPYELWLLGAGHVEQWWRGPGEVCRGSIGVVTSANDRPAIGVYHPAGDDRWEPFALHVLDVADGRLRAITHFMGPEVFAEFELPDHLTSATR